MAKSETLRPVPKWPEYEAGMGITPAYGHETKPQKRPDGSMPFRYRWVSGKLYGGPYLNKPNDMFGVKMAKEIIAPCDIDIPTPDFSVPPVDLLKKGLVDTFAALFSGRDVYVGCMGGTGRTGLFMACFVRLMGEACAVGHVREHYKKHAVETETQKLFVNTLDLTEERAKVNGMISQKLVFPWSF